MRAPSPWAFGVTPNQSIWHGDVVFRRGAQVAIRRHDGVVRWFHRRYAFRVPS